MTPALRKDTTIDFATAVARVPEALKTQGFGVLTHIDVAATMKAKLGADFRRYEIFGACNPPLAHQALGVMLEVGVMLPCNVVVYERDGGGATVLAVDPAQTMAGQDPQLAAIAAEVRARLVRVLEQF